MPRGGIGGDATVHQQLVTYAKGQSKKTRPSTSAVCKPSPDISHHRTYQCFQLWKSDVLYCEPQKITRHLWTTKSHLSDYDFAATVNILHCIDSQESSKWLKDGCEFESRSCFFLPLSPFLFTFSTTDFKYNCKWCFKISINSPMISP